MNLNQREKNLASLIKGMSEFARQSSPSSPSSGQPEASPRASPVSSPDDSGQGRSTSLVLAKNALNGGEISPGLSARFDQARYQTGCHRLLNMVPLPCGGVSKRPGFLFAGFAGTLDASGPVRLVPFVFSETETRLLEFYGNEAGVFLRVWRPERGAGGVGLVRSGDLLKLPWRGDWLEKMRFCQSGDVVYCACEDTPPGKLMRRGDEDWSYADLRWTPGIAAPRIDHAHYQGNYNETGAWIPHVYLVTAIDKDTGEESMPSEKITEIAQALRQDFFIRIWIKSRDDIGEIRVYKRDGGVFGYIGSTTEKDDDGLFVFDDKNIAPDTEDSPPEYRNPFDGPDKYPALVFMFQQRLGFASSRAKPLTVWLSPSGHFESMAASQPPDDDDAIEATLATPRASRILWVMPDRRGLIIGSGGGEWVLSGAGEEALSPKNISFQPQSSWGSQAGLEPLEAGGSLLFASRGGRVVRDLAYSYADDKYQATDLSILARHILARSPVVSWAWQQEPYGIVWMATADGSLAGLTYLREHEIVAWHRHSTDGEVRQLVSLPGPDGNSLLIALVNRKVSQAGEPRACVEYLEPFAEESVQPRHTDGFARSPYPCRLIPCLGEAGSENGTTFGRPMKINAVKIRVLNSRPFKARVISFFARPSPLFPVPARPVGAPAIGDDPADAAGIREEDWSCPLPAGFRDGARLELVLDGPDPATILGIVATLEYAEAAGGQV